MRRLEATWHWIIEAITWGSRASIGLMVVLITVEVILRKFFTFSIVGTVEIVAALMVITVFLSWAYTDSYNGHVRVEFLVQRLGRKTQSALSAIITLVLLSIFSIIIWQTMVYAMDAFEVGLRYDTARLPVFPVRLAIPVGIFFFCLQLIKKLISSIAGLLPTQNQVTDN
ncbi:TRAP transporter small permease subunit [Chloroflexota bacterium]